MAAEQGHRRVLDVEAEAGEPVGRRGDDARPVVAEDGDGEQGDHARHPPSRARASVDGDLDVDRALVVAVRTGRAVEAVGIGEAEVERRRTVGYDDLLLVAVSRLPVADE